LFFGDKCLFLGKKQRDNAIFFILLKNKNMDLLTIHYGIQGNGVCYGLTYSHYNIVKKLLPHAQPAKAVFVEYDFRGDFKTRRPELERIVFPTLVGTYDENELKQFKRIEFVKTPEMVVTYVIDQTNPQQEDQYYVQK
jgi:hypothetical protein